MSVLQEVEVSVGYIRSWSLRAASPLSKTLTHLTLRQSHTSSPELFHVMLTKLISSVCTWVA
jgi:hypothetical protein